MSTDRTAQARAEAHAILALTSAYSDIQCIDNSRNIGRDMSRDSAHAHICNLTVDRLLAFAARVGEEQRVAGYVTACTDYAAIRDPAPQPTAPAGWCCRECAEKCPHVLTSARLMKEGSTARAQAAVNLYGRDGPPVPQPTVQAEVCHCNCCGQEACGVTGHAAGSGEPTASTAGGAEPPLTDDEFQSMLCDLADKAAPQESSAMRLILAVQVETYIRDRIRRAMESATTTGTSGVTTTGVLVPALAPTAREVDTYCNKSSDDEIPRRIDLQRMTPAELAIRVATLAVEEVGAHPLLTEAVILLGQAREKVADYVDGMRGEGR